MIRRDLRLVGQFALCGERCTLGRSRQCDVTLEHPSVSRYHARLERRGQRWHIIDNGSTNGVLLNGQPVTEAAIDSSDVIEIRPFSLTYLAGEPESGDQSIQLAGSAAVVTTAQLPLSAAGVARQRLEDLYALARLVIKRQESGVLWHSVQTALQRSLAADRCVVIGLDESENLYRLAPAAGVGAALNVSRSILGEVIDSHQAVLVEHVGDDQKYAQALSLAGGVGSVICVPVVVEGQTRAIVYTDRSESTGPFGREDLDFVTAAVDLAAAAAELDELQEKARELAQVHGRIETAREIQELLLPRPIPQPGWAEVAARNFPADQMSGDIYDVAIDAAGRLLVMLADVAGKGVPAAFLTAILHNTLRMSLEGSEELSQIVQRLNAAVYRQSPTGSFATMVVCRWSPSGDAVEIINAGHLAPLWLQPDQTVEAFPERVGLPLGIGEAWRGRVVQYDASQALSMMVYSDGAAEAQNEQAKEYGLDRLQRAFSQARQHRAERIVDAIADDVREYCQPHEPADDLTLVVVKYAPRP